MFEYSQAVSYLCEKLKAVDDAQMNDEESVVRRADEFNGALEAAQKIYEVNFAQLNQDIAAAVLAQEAE